MNEIFQKQLNKIAKTLTDDQSSNLIGKSFWIGATVTGEIAQISHQNFDPLAAFEELNATLIHPPVAGFTWFMIYFYELSDGRARQVIDEAYQLQNNGEWVLQQAKQVTWHYISSDAYELLSITDSEATVDQLKLASGRDTFSDGDIFKLLKSVYSTPLLMKNIWREGDEWFEEYSFYVQARRT